LKPRAKR